MVDRLSEEASEYGPLPALFEGTTDALVVVRLEGNDSLRIHTVNESFTEMFGWEPSEIEGEDPVEYLFPGGDPPDGWADIRDRVIFEGEDVELEGWRQTKQGERYFIVQGIPFGTETLPVDGTYIAYTDITDRIELRREQELNQRITTLNEYATAFEQAESRTEAFDIAEKAVEKLYGMGTATSSESTPDIAKAVGTEGLLAPEVATRAEDRSTPILASGEGFESLLTDRVGETTLQIGATEADAFTEGDVQILELLTSHLRSTLDRLERETELREERERLEIINRVLRHNLLNGLNVVRSRIQLVRPGVEDSTASERLDTALNRSENMLDLVQTMRTFMRTIVQDNDHELQPTALQPVVETEVEKIRNANEGADVAIDDDIPDVSVRADALLPEVLDNLLRNAIEHNDKPTPRIVVSFDVDDETVSVHVADNGPGIEDDRKDKIFEKGASGFERPGSGFGLYLVREIIDSYDGSISVGDNDPHGTVFTITLARTDHK